MVCCACSVQIELSLKGSSVCVVAGVICDFLEYLCDSQTDFVAASCYSTFAGAIPFA